MHLSQRKEDISISYISAICAYNGVAYDIIRHDHDSVDGSMMKRITLENGYDYDVTVHIQLKCTNSLNCYTENEDEIIYQLKVKNYNDLCKQGTVPKLLGLLVLPANEDWVHWSKEELAIKGCMYWAYLGGSTPSNNSSTVSVYIKKENVINIENIDILLKRIAEEEWI